MPFIMARVNVPVTREQEEIIRERLGRAIEAIPGKSADSLLLGIEDGCRFYLRGKAQKVAYIEASVFGNEDHSGFASFVQELAAVFHEVLDIPAGSIFAKFEDITAWSVHGMFIDGSRRR